MEHQLTDYNPSGAMAESIAAKLRERKRILAKNQSSKGENPSVILSRYISILAVGEKKDINDLAKYTVYQLFDEFQRFNLREDYELFIKGKLAGAKNMDKVENWMKDLHSNS